MFQFISSVLGSDNTTTDLHADLDIAKDDIRRLKSQLKRARNDLSSFQSQMETERHQYERKIRESQALLASRVSEVESSRAFLDKADGLAPAEVVDMVKQLNAEIFQTAAFAAEAFHPESDSDMLEGEGGEDEDEDEFEEIDGSALEGYGDGSGERKRVVDLLGPRMTRVLEKRKGKDSLVVQTALQACMVVVSMQAIRSWGSASGDGSTMLNSVYESMVKSERQTISGRWRALTLKYLPQGDEAAISSTLQNAFADILSAAGCEGGSDSFQDVMVTLDDRLSVAARMVVKLKKAIQLEITSYEMEAFAGIAGEELDTAIAESTFEKDPKDAAHTKSEAEVILCTTDLGLRMGEKAAEGEIKQKILLKPRVVVESFFLDQPPVPTPSRR